MEYPVEYSMIRMSFLGFSKEDFDFFIDRDENKRRNLKTRMETLWGAVKNRLPANLASKFQFGRVGVLRRDAYSCWGCFSEYDDFPRFTHISMAFSVDGFRVWLNTETVSAINRLKENIERDPLTFLNLLKSLVEEGPYYVQLIEREKIEGEPLPVKWPWFTVLESYHLTMHPKTFQRYLREFKIFKGVDKKLVISFDQNISKMQRQTFVRQGIHIRVEGFQD